MKIALHGSIMVDQVYQVDSFADRRHKTTCATKSYKQVGAMGNTARLLRNRFPQLETACVGSVGQDENGRWIIDTLKESGVITDGIIEIDWAHTSTGTIVVDDDKTSIVDISACRWHPISNPLPEADWHHFMYLDDIHSIEPGYLDNITGIKSADLCKAEPTADDLSRLYGFLPKLDYLIIAHQEADALHGSPLGVPMETKARVLGAMVQGYVIIHDKFNIYASDGDSVVHMTNNPLEGINVLGAGDFFAGSFIGQSLLSPDHGIVERIKCAHSITEGYLSENQPIDSNSG